MFSLFKEIDRLKRQNKTLENEIQQYKEAIEYRDNFIAVSTLGFFQPKFPFLESRISYTTQQHNTTTQHNTTQHNTIIQYNTVQYIPYYIDERTLGTDH